MVAMYGMGPDLGGQQIAQAIADAQAVATDADAMQQQLRLRRAVGHAIAARYRIPPNAIEIDDLGRHVKLGEFVLKVTGHHVNGGKLRHPIGLKLHDMPIEHPDVLVSVLMSDVHPSVNMVRRAAIRRGGVTYAVLTLIGFVAALAWHPGMLSSITMLATAIPAAAFAWQIFRSFRPLLPLQRPTFEPLVPATPPAPAATPSPAPTS